MRRLSIILLLIGICVGPLLATTGAQEVIPLSDPIYQEMDLLYLITGTGTPSASRPWTKAEAQKLLSNINAGEEGSTQHALYASIHQTAYESLRWLFPDEFGLSANLDLSLEGYAHHNPSYNSLGRWNYAFPDRKPLARLRLDMAISDFFYTYSDLQYGYGLYTYDDVIPHLGDDHDSFGALIPEASTNNIYYIDGSTPLIQYQKRFANNLIPASKHFDFQWPKRAVFSVGSGHWNLTFSRDRISWGNSRIGNFILDDHIDFHEYLRFTAFSNYFKYEALMVFFDTYYANEPHIRMLLAHRLEFRPWEKLTLAVSENVMYKDDFLDVRFLNPSFIYHNLHQESKFNAIAHAELAYVPVSGVRLYGQFALDQAVAPNEDPDEEDTAWALSLGLEVARPLERGVLSSVWEASMALPSMYRRDHVDFLMIRRYAGLGRTVHLLDYIGSPYGGDALVFLSETNYHVPSVGTLSLTFTAALKGEIDMYTPSIGGTTDYGAVLFSQNMISTAFCATLSGKKELELSLSGIERWEIYSSLSYLSFGEYLQSSHTFTLKSWDIQVVLGTSVTF
ncbi:hypothetical protein [uncultured Sphaerochaeta sp.]|uniref:hypothetical protein n=1 Tax=uncultured Sphaerochaeta sp. TaxID=886478 RepID=UPI002AA5F55E|nr:hypothetical protein [uncultured Sphaerochaeta sp.]